MLHFHITLPKTRHKTLFTVVTLLLSLYSLTAGAQEYKTARISTDGGKSYAEFSTAKDIDINLDANDVTLTSKDVDGNEVTIAKMPSLANAVMTIHFQKKSDDKLIDDINVPVTNAGYATYYSPFPVKIPDATYGTVYIPTLSSDGKSLVINEDTQIKPGTILPACTGMVIKIGDESTASFSALRLGSESISDETSVLSGSVISRPVADFTGDNDKQIYTLAKVDGITGFYRFNPENDSVVAQRAFLLMDKSAEAKCIILQTDDDITNVADVTGATTADSDNNIYNAIGQRVSRRTKGVIIKNGKKYVNN